MAATTQGFTAKTHGWQVGTLTIDAIVDRCGINFCCWTANRRFAFAEQQHIDLAGLSVKDLVAFPAGWAVQEINAPRGWCQGIYNNTPKEGMPWYAEIHDLWTTRKLTSTEFDKLVGRNSNAPFGPGMLGPSPTATEASSTMDFEQVVAARSRTWGANLSNLFGYGSTESEVTQPDINVRLQFGNLVHDNVWGSGEPIASTYLYHTRIYITNLDADAYSNPPQQSDVPPNGTFCTFPSSIQPMLAVLDKPNFITRMTYKRRSLDV